MKYKRIRNIQIKFPQRDTKLEKKKETCLKLYKVQNCEKRFQKTKY